MDVRQCTARCGGVADRATLVRLTSRAAVDGALRHGDLVRVGHGRYALPATDVALRAASALDGVVSHRTAALLHGWELKTVPRLPDVLVPASRKVDPGRRGEIRLHRGTYRSDERQARITSPVRTLVACLRTLPFDEALAVADSALRHRAATHAELADIVGPLRGPGAARARQVAAHADGRAANPFESVLRAIAIGIPGLDVRPQVEIVAPSFAVRPDLVDLRRRIVLEADSFAWHGDRVALRADARRYNNLVVRGWLVLRFSWEDVMHDPASVRRTLAAVVELTDPCTAAS